LNLRRKARRRPGRQGEGQESKEEQKAEEGEQQALKGEQKVRKAKGS